jgi:hypothetical protein
MAYKNNEDGWHKRTTRHKRTTNGVIEDACIQQNRYRFFQCWNTPFMVSPLVDGFGYLANTTSGQQVLNGMDPTSDGPDYYARLLLDQFYIPAEVTKLESISVPISREEHQQWWKKHNERTSSKSTGFSFNHYKAV